MSRISLYCLLAAGFMCAGCATAARPEAMTAVLHLPVHQSWQSSSTVSVSVVGGSPTSSIGMSQISDEDFAAALQQSIEQSKLFARVLTDGTGDYRLLAFIAQLDHPFIGTSLTVSMEVDYTLSRNQSTQVVWRKAITSSYTAPFSAAFVAATRLRLAMEGAARKNIEQAMQEISQLRLD